jgi:CRP/FNR family cyclic AMP-dependent transcriptional regulator
VDVPQLLSDIPLFSGLDRAGLDQLAHAMRIRRYLPEDVILQEGHDSFHGGMGVLISGAANVVRGPDQVLSRLRQGDIFGELALLDDEPRSASVIAETETEVAFVTRGDFRRLIREHPDIAMNLLIILAKRLRAVEMQEHSSLGPRSDR